MSRLRTTGLVIMALVVASRLDMIGHPLEWLAVGVGLAGCAMFLASYSQRRT